MGYAERVLWKKGELSRKMKRILCLTLACLIALTCLPSCGTRFYTQGEGELKIVTTVFVPFDIAREITGGAAELILLQSNGADLHDYTPTAAALSELNTADILICVGGVTDDTWINDAIAASENKELTVIRLTEHCEGILTELEGHGHGEHCEKAHAHGHEHDEHSHGHSIDDGHGHTADEHVWTSIRNVIRITEHISSVCAEKDPINAGTYRANAERYKRSLPSLTKGTERSSRRPTKRHLCSRTAFHLYISRTSMASVTTRRSAAAPARRTRALLRQPDF